MMLSEKPFLRMLSLLLAVTLALSAAPSALATATVTVSSSATIEDTDAISGMAGANGTLYLLYQSGKLMSRPIAADEPALLGTVLCSMGVGDPEQLKPKEGEIALDRLFINDGQLCGFCTATGEGYRLLDDTGAFAPEKLPVKLDTSALVEATGDQNERIALELRSCFAQDGWLYYTGVSYTSAYATFAGRINLQTGAAQAFQMQNVTELAPYRDGRVLALIYDASAIYSATTTEDALGAQAQYAVLNPDSDAAETTDPLSSDGALGGFAVSGLAYGGDSLFYRDGSRLMGLRMETGETRVSAYTGEGLYGGGGVGGHLYLDGYYASYSYSGLSVLELDSETLKNGALTIFGEFGSDAHTAFVKAHPEIPVDVSGDYTSDIEKLTQAMLSENKAYDVLMLSLGYMPVERLQQKGYCADLSGYPELVERVSQMYPIYSDALTVDGKLYGVPVSVTGLTYAVNMERWTALGLTEDDLPTSLLDLYDFAANWVYDYGEENPDLALFDYQQPGEILFSLLLNQYIAFSQREYGSLRFDTDVYKKLLAAYSAIDFDEIKSVSDSDKSGYWNAEALFYVYQPVGFLANQSDKNIRQIYLSMTGEDEPFVVGIVNVLIINPKTKRMDDAVLYLQSYLEHLDATSANISLFPDHNDAVENTGYPKRKEELEKALADAKERLESAAEENKAAIRDEVSQAEESLAHIEEIRYSVTAEAIADYRVNVAPLIYVQRQNALYSADTTAVTEINKLLMQYLEGAIDEQQLVTELDKRVRLMELEDQ